jgi:hypothetical protein
VTDRYPPFSLESDPHYPVDVEVEYPESSSKTLAALSLARGAGDIGSIFLPPPADTGRSSWRRFI